jgi:hypothetical protein
MVKTWKEARTLLLHEKGERGEIRDWRPISITVSIDRVFTYLLFNVTAVAERRRRGERGAAT